jgi:hypothetical protein
MLIREHVSERKSHRKTRVAHRADTEIHPFQHRLVPTLASSITWRMILIAVGTLTYAIAESLRLSGVDIGFISRSPAWPPGAATRVASSWACTLGLEPGRPDLLPHPAASLAIYALAFGDGWPAWWASRRQDPPSLHGGKSLEGAWPASWRCS